MAKVLDTPEDDQRCLFCHENFVDEIQCGKLYLCEDVITHYFCMLFSSQMEQNGKDDEGILGFLPSDVKKEVNRGKKIECVYCKHPGATVACSVKHCRKKFHYPCGVENGSMHQFFDQFKSFCVSHRKIQNVPQSACRLTEKYVCVMCQEEVKPKPSLSTIWAPCCKTAWFHRICIQQMASSAGYFFKCPNCNNKNEFRKEMSEYGIYIPDQDASWEGDPNAFTDLANRHNFCDADNCLCPKGRTYAPSDGLWEIILCMYCGSQGIHTRCGKNQLDDVGQWSCPVCSVAVGQKPFSSVSDAAELEDPGPSSTATSVETRGTHTRRNRRPCRRKRIGSDDESCSSSSKKKIIDSSSSADEDSDSTSCLYNNSGEQIEVVRCNAASVPSKSVVEIGGVSMNLNVVLVDSDDNESDVECNMRSTTRLERPPLIPRPTSSRSRGICDTVINLDSDDDDHSYSSSTKLYDNVTSTSNTDLELQDDSDDVVFVSCDDSNTDKDSTLCGSTALLRFVENNTVYIVSPADVKRRGGIENLTSTFNPSRSSENNHPPSNSSSKDVWQSVPIHKSIVHSLAANQMNQDFNPIISHIGPLEEFLQKKNSDTQSKSENNTASNVERKWKPDSSEIIFID